MYTDFYGLSEKPFALVPDPRFLYLGYSHREALAHVLYAIDQSEGFTAVIGQVGTGKTTLIRTLLERLDPSTDIAFIFNPSPSAGQLLAAINREFGLETRERSRSDLVHDLNMYLLDQKGKGRRVLLAIDEAQTLDAKVLEQVRLISNLETGSEKLIQILLVGQPELDEKLARPDLRQLRQRITVRWKLEPFGRRETRAYVEHRLRIGGTTRRIFTAGGTRAIYRASGGVPRLINAICDRALLAGYAEGKREIGARSVWAAARQLPSVDNTALLASFASPGVRAMALVGVGTALAVGLPVLASLGVSRGEPARVESLRPFAGIDVGAGRATPADVLGAGSVLESAAVALDAVLESCGYPPQGLSEVDPDLFVRAIAQASPLRVLATRATPGQVLLLNLPAILEIELASGEPRYVAVVGLGAPGEVEITTARGTFLVDRTRIDEVATGRVFLFWTNFESLPVLRPGMSGDRVAWVQEKLAELGYLEHAEPTGLFDYATGEAVRGLQNEHGIDQTGEVGPKTLIALYQELRYGAPLLNASGGSL